MTGIVHLGLRLLVTDPMCPTLHPTLPSLPNSQKPNGPAPYYDDLGNIPDPFIRNTTAIAKISYLISRCCSDRNHCTNADDKDFSESLLAGFVHLKNELIKHLVRLGVVNFKVMDSCCVTTCSTTANNSERLRELRGVYNSDGVHFTADGHTNLANRVIGCLRTLLLTPKKKTSQSTYFWRGFRSRRGSLAHRINVGKANWNGGGIVASNHAASGPRGRVWGGPSRGGSSNSFRGYHAYRRR